MRYFLKLPCLETNRKAGTVAKNYWSGASNSQGARPRHAPPGWFSFSPSHSWWASKSRRLRLGCSEVHRCIAPLFVHQVSVCGLEGQWHKGARSPVSTERGTNPQVSIKSALEDAK